MAVTKKEGRFETLDEKQTQINLSLMSFFNFTNTTSKKELMMLVLTKHMFPLIKVVSEDKRLSQELII